MTKSSIVCGKIISRGWWRSAPRGSAPRGLCVVSWLPSLFARATLGLRLALAFARKSLTPAVRKNLAKSIFCEVFLGFGRRRLGQAGRAGKPARPAGTDGGAVGTPHTYASMCKSNMTIATSDATQNKLINGHFAVFGKSSNDGSILFGHKNRQSVVCLAIVAVFDLP